MLNQDFSSLTASISAQQSWQGSYGETKSVSYCLFKIHLFSLCLWNSVDLWVEDSFHKVMRGPCKDSDMLKELQLFDQWFCFLLESWMHQLDKFFWFQFCFTMFSILYSPSCLAKAFEFSGTPTIFGWMGRGNSLISGIFWYQYWI